MLKAKNITVQIGEKLLVNDVSVSLEAGQVLAICGPNGAGKSTLLRVLSGESIPTHGRVSLHGQAMASWRPLELATLRALLHQQSLLSFPFQVDEVVTLGRFPYRNSRDDEIIVRECLEQVGMLDFQHRTYTTLSGGEKQRVQLARVLAQLTNDNQKGKLLLLDEPTSALDLPHQESTLAIAAHYAKTQNHAVVVVLHDLNLAASWADRVLFLHDGKMVCEGPPHQTISSENIQAIYGLDTHILPHPDTDRPVVLVRRTPSPNER